MDIKNPILIVISAFRGFWLDVETGKLLPHVAGGEGPMEGTDPLEEIPSDFGGLSEDDLRELHSKIEARYQAEKADAKTKLQVDQLKAYREAQQRIVGEISNRQTEAKEVVEALATLEQAPPLPEPSEGEGDNENEGGENEPAEPAQPADTPAATPEAIAAGLSAADIAAGRTGQTVTEKRPAPVTARPRAAMTAAASQQVIPFGTEVDLDAIGRIAEGVKHQLRPQREAVRAYVASVPAFEEMSGLGVQILSTNNALSQNDTLIAESVAAHMARRAERMGRKAPAAMTAAICDPLDIIREIPDYVSQADPLTAALPNRPISRLGYTFTPAISLSGVTSGVQAGWDDADQSSVDPDDPETWKPCYDAACGSPCEVTANAATACMTFDVTTEMSNPERIRDIMSKLTAARIRARTVQLLDVMDGLSIAWTRTGDYSLLPDTIYAVEDALTRMTYPERLDPEDYTLFVPWGYLGFLVSDVHGKTDMTEAEFNATKDAMRRHLEGVLGTDVVELRDETDSIYTALPAVGDAPAALSDAPCTWPLRLIHTPSALYGSTGLIDTGIQSDPQLARQNKRQWFQEEFTLLTKHGSPPWAKIDLTSAASGSRAAASTKLACA